jgi:predicted transposase/invertase (TIGR01784 family)
MMKVVPLRFGTAFKKAFSDSEVFSRFASDVLGEPIEVTAVHQEYRYPDAVGRVKVEYDLFAEDEKHRVIVEVQHVRERNFFERFLHYHLVGIIEQVPSHRSYEAVRTVYTLVVLTTEPKDKELRFSVAVSDVDPVDERGRRLGVYRHKLVFLNPKVINEDTPPAARRWMELIADSLDGEVEDMRYDDPLMQRVLGSIRDESLSPDELAKVIDENEWEETKRDARREGMREGERKAKREVLLWLMRSAGLALGPEHLARIEGCGDLAELDRWIARVHGAARAADVLDG